MSSAPTTESGPSPPVPTCNASDKLCPVCKEGEICRLSVIEASYQCPKAECIKLSFDTGADNDEDGNTPDSSSGGSSALAPILGVIAGLGFIALIAFFVIRRRQRRKRAMMLGQDDSLDSFSSKRWDSTGSAGHKDVIRIAYIPSMISDSSIATPEPSVQTGGVLKPDFTSLREDQDRNKHDSLASLDEAVVMAVTAKATPQVMKLNTIKSSQTDLIQRSNVLHTTNSIKRSQSQRRLADVKANGSTKATSSPLRDEQYDDEDDSDQETVEDHKVATKKPSVGPMSERNNQDNPFMTEAELAVASTKASCTDNTRSNDNNDNDNRSTTRSSNPFLSIAESTVVGSSTGPNTPMSPSFTNYSSRPETPMSPMSETTTTAFTSGPINHSGRLMNEGAGSYDDPLAGLPTPNLRPWASSSGTGPMRDSTFSTMSDSRSSTRGDGEEIMIFWDGQRDSKAM
ncbi:hypothetical protein BX616_006432 [Lobosporangium transversale]|uniref:Membrane anchor Opy2 N-terminal domain-containing protein n=1 Tax=Lobosporangium transversale TaxID=64571 RepID=A0A1Y2H225_9FUNG|nr:hypothetical protein BCR41DRAFT_343758 [Lobosporangium transversale]KAF9915314.1 hypothetical protein BX616_006432 [Lobosporangium transversale]ORZ28598.1 hypothetical protein BCR41DRAFT_343758 [Lobosporangium transversale]|eukprot:XP_021886271.1 hypothetical protein BCR41DRAFT_343758 [Lobosporangium transversale]